VLLLVLLLVFECCCCCCCCSSDWARNPLKLAIETNFATSAVSRGVHRKHRITGARAELGPTLWLSKWNSWGDDGIFAIEFDALRDIRVYDLKGSACVRADGSRRLAGEGDADGPCEASSSSKDPPGPSDAATTTSTTTHWYTLRLEVATEMRDGQRRQRRDAVWTVHGLWPSGAQNLVRTAPRGGHTMDPDPINSPCQQGRPWVLLREIHGDGMPLRRNLEQCMPSTVPGVTNYNFWWRQYDKHGRCALPDFRGAAREVLYFQKIADLYGIWEPQCRTEFRPGTGNPMFPVHPSRDRARCEVCFNRQFQRIPCPVR
jgi:hypothetical protein